MARTQPRGYHRDTVTGRFVSTSNTPESSEGRFETYAELPVEFDGADPSELAYGMEPRCAPAGDVLAQGGQRSPLRARNPTLLDPRDETFHNGPLRSAVRRHGGPMDPSAFLTGLEPGIQATSAAAEDDSPAMRPAGQGAGRGRFR